jgi:hypothetical protein
MDFLVRVFEHTSESHSSVGGKLRVHKNIYEMISYGDKECFLWSCPASEASKQHSVESYAQSF